MPSRLPPSHHWPHLANDVDYHAGTLADRFGLSLRQVERFFEENVGMAPKAWLHIQRMIKARYRLLELRRVTPVAQEFGYKHVCHFSRDFQKCYGMPPTEFLRRFGGYWNEVI